MAVNYSTHAIAPALPVLQDVWGASEAQIALYQAVYMLPGAIAGIPLGVLNDRLGRRRAFMLFSSFFGVFGFSQALTTSFSVVLVLRLLAGISMAGMMPLTITIISDIRRGVGQVSGQAARQVALALTGFIWPLVGVALVTIDWRLPFIATLPILGAALWGARVLDDNPTPVRRSGYMEETRQLVRSFPMVVLLSIGAIRFMIKAGVSAYLPLYLVNELGVSVWTGAAVLSIQGAMATVGAALGPRAVRRFNNTAMLIAVAATASISVLLIGLPESVIVVCGAAVVFGLSEGLLGLIQVSFEAANAPARIRGAVFGISATMKSWGRFLGPGILSAAALNASLGIGFVILGSTTLVLTPLLISVRSMAPPNEIGA